MRSVCFVHKDIGDLDRGGICVSYKVLINEFKKLGWKIYCITQREFSDDEITVFKVPPEKDIYKHSENVRKVLDKFNCDIVEASNYKFELINFLQNRKGSKNKGKVVIRCNPSCTTLLFEESLLTGERAQCCLADKVISVSKFTARDIKTAYGISHSDVVYEGIDLRYWSKFEKRKEINSGYQFINNTDIPIQNISISEFIKKDKINIFWVAKPTLMKGYDYLTEIINNSDDEYNFIVNCANIDLKMFNQLISPNLTVVRGLDRNDQISLWSRCDATLVTSRVEGFCYVAAESLLLGKKLIANQECEVLREFPAQRDFVYFNPKKITNLAKIGSQIDHSEIHLSAKELSFFDSKTTGEKSESIYLSLLSS